MINKCEISKLKLCTVIHQTYLMNCFQGLTQKFKAVFSNLSQMWDFLAVHIPLAWLFCFFLYLCVFFSFLFSFSECSTEWELSDPASWQYWSKPNVISSGFSDFEPIQNCRKRFLIISKVLPEEHSLVLWRANLEVPVDPQFPAEGNSRRNAPEHLPYPPKTLGHSR